MIKAVHRVNAIFKLAYLSSSCASIKMASTSMHVEVAGGIEGSYPGSSDGVDQQLMNYVSFRQSTHVNYNVNDTDVQVSEEKLSKSAHYVQHELPTDVLQSRNDYRSTLELATR